MIEPLLKLGLWLAALVVLSPLLASAVVRQRNRIEGREPAADLQLFGESFSGALAPIVEIVRSFGEPATHSKGFDRFFRPFLWLAPLFVLMALVPFGGEFMFGERRIALVVAEFEGGLFWVLAALSASALLRLFSAVRNQPAVSSARARRTVALQLATLTTLLGLVAVIGELDLLGLVLAQDATLTLLPTSTAAWHGFVAVPRWGLFLQPLGGMLLAVCLVAQSARPPFSDPEEEEDFARREGPAFRLATGLAYPVHAALFTALMLGGGAIPYLPAHTLVAAVASVYGDGFATGFVLVVQAAVFFAKTALVVLGLAALADAGERLPRFLQPQWLVERLFPLALVNLLVTVVVLGFTRSLG